MSQEEDRSRQHHTENYRPEFIKNYRPATTHPIQQPGKPGVDGNHVPTTDTAPSSPPPKPKK